MPKMEAVSKRNCAITVQLPAATSCASEITNETKAKATAAMNDASATTYSNFRDLCLTIFCSMLLGVSGHSEFFVFITPRPYAN